MLAALRNAGMKTAILSNLSPRMLQFALENAGIASLLDDVLSIEDVGIFKVSPKTYQLAVDRLAMAPEAICFKSSSAWDATGAVHLGFQVAWVNRFGQLPERLLGTPKAEIGSLDPLLNLIRR
jgi:2-haloacid dehalogenase